MAQTSLPSPLPPKHNTDGISTDSSIASKKSSLRPSTSDSDRSQSQKEWKLPCGICRRQFSAGRPEALFSHMDGHFQHQHRYYRCSECQINFVTEADRDKHLLSASTKQECGFLFEHRQPCRGHHPPRRGKVRDDNRFDFCYRLRDWEGAQLNVYYGSSATASVAAPRRRRSSLASFSDHVKRPFLSHSRPSDKASPSHEQTRYEHTNEDMLGAMLLRAICTGSVELVKAFINAGANTGFTDAFGFGAMHYSAQYGTSDIAWLVRQAGVDVNTLDGQGKSPLAHAVSTRRGSLVPYLIAWGAQAQSEDLHVAVETGNVDDAEKLIEWWARENKRQDLLDALLLKAVAQRHRRIVEVLLANGARALVRDATGKTALSLVEGSAAFEDKEIALLLVEYGMDEFGGLRTKENEPLAEIMKYRHLAMVDMMLTKRP